VEVDLTCQILEGAIQAHVQRYVQLSSIIVYGTPTSPKSINETFPAHPELVIDRAAWEREQMVRTMGSERGLDTVILQPASTIGQRDQGSFFHRIYQAHIQNKFPLIGNGMARFSCVDTRDIGRAMVWLGEADTSVRGETYLLKGYDTSWLELKTALDQARGVVSGAQRLPSWMAFGIAGLLERVMVTPSLDRRTVRALTTDRIYDNRKLRGTGFAPRYQLAESIEEALAEKKNR
jgi:nucleoside-diphosphate-sugar epimerase